MKRSYNAKYGSSFFIQQACVAQFESMAQSRLMFYLNLNAFLFVILLHFWPFQ